MALPRRHNKMLYRSGLEQEAATFLKTRQKTVEYEKIKIEWEDLRYRTYTPDFELDNGIIIETKGLFTSADRQKMRLVKEQHPEKDIRFVFSNSRSRISKKSSTTYAMWCDKYGFKYADKHIPLEWLNGQ